MLELMSYIESWNMFNVSGIFYALKDINQFAFVRFSSNGCLGMCR